MESLTETLSVDFPQPRSIWRLFPDVRFCLIGIHILISMIYIISYILYESYNMIELISQKYCKIQ